MKRQNRKNIQIREQQFSDHFLKGKAAPVLLEKGVPATLKEIDWGSSSCKLTSLLFNKFTNCIYF